MILCGIFGCRGVGICNCYCIFVCVEICNVFSVDFSLVWSVGYSWVNILIFLFCMICCNLLYSFVSMCCLMEMNFLLSECNFCMMDWVLFDMSVWLIDVYDVSEILCIVLISNCVSGRGVVLVVVILLCVCLCNVVCNVLSVIGLCNNMWMFVVV